MHALRPSAVPLFVYGSLKRGFRHDALLRRAPRLSEASVPGCRLVLLGEYPALVQTGHGLVHGELYLVDRTLLAELDVFEDCPGLYQRRLLRLSSGACAFTYAVGRAQASECPLLNDSRWTE